MITSGEFNNIITTSSSNIEFEKYCKNEGVSSLLIKSEIYSLYNIKKINFFKGLVTLLKKDRKSNEIIKSN